MSLIPFPSVPDVPGVPAIPRIGGATAFASIGLGVLQSTLLRMFQTNTRWGIYDDQGNALGDPSLFTGIIGNALETIGIGGQISTGSVEISKETRISDFPVEAGSFASYNKVELPANPVVTLNYGGSESDRKEFLSQIDDACISTDLYSIVTPEVTYINYSVERYDFDRRSTNGVTLLSVHISLKEIREVSAQYSQSNASQIQSPQDVGATPQVDSGKVQPTTPDVSTLKSLTTKFSGLFGL